MKVFIKNVQDTKDLKAPAPFKSWLEYWENHSNCQLEPEILYECPHCKKAFPRDEFDGCHVQKVFDRSGRMYIIPLCDGCNHSSDIFNVDLNLLVPTP